MTEEMLAKLNSAQREAVTWDARPLLIIAGAGSGKTRILTHRIVYLILKGVPAFQILGVTFTNKAAEEMKKRVHSLIRQDVWVSTFHSACLRILRIEGPMIGLDRQFTIYDEQDQLILIKECLHELNVNDKQVHPKGVRERIQRAKDFLVTPYQYAEKAGDVYEEVVARIYQLYEEKLNRLKACDFGDLIMKTVALFDRRKDVLANWQERFHHILIDEYQDTNHAQYRFVRLLAEKRRQITVVGDPDQSIYAWRGADIRNILNFEKDYPDCGIIKMERNYRSKRVILDAANELIQHNRIRKPKALWTEDEGGEKISLFEALDEKEEAEYIIHQILKARQEGKTFADQVIFYRVHAQSRILEDVLRRYKIPYRIVGGVRFYDRKEIKDAVAYLRAICYPHDDVSLKRILNVPSRGIGKKTLEVLESRARKDQLSFDQVLQESSKIHDLSSKMRETLSQFYRLLTGFRREQDQGSLKDLIEQVLEKTGYLAELKLEKTIESEARIENLEEFFSVIADFEERPSPEGLEEKESSRLQEFLESISLMTDLDAWDSGTDILTLMTLHTAKGLEFPVVYMVGLEEGIFPNVNSYTEDPEDLEEERRLCYVGLTRAKEKIHLTYARERRIYGSKQYNLPSRFLNEIPSGLYESERRAGLGLMMEDDELPERADKEEETDDIVIEPDPDELKRRILFD